MNARLMVAAVICMAGAAQVAVAVPVTESFSTTAGWTAVEDGSHGNEMTPEGGAYATTLDAVSIGTPASSALRITGGNAVTDFETDKIRMNSGTDFLGNYTGAATPPGTIVSQVQGIYFDFYIDTAVVSSAPAQLGLYFIGDAHEWYWDLTDSLVYNTAWNRYGANMSGSSEVTDFGSWYDMSGNGNWTTDIADVTEIGVVLGYVYNEGAQVYAIDNFTIQEDPFLVPEPETYAFLAMAILALGLVFRKQVDESLRAAFAHVRV